MVAAMLTIMAKLSVILRSECMNNWEFLHSLGNKLKVIMAEWQNAIKDHLLFCKHVPDFEDFSIFATNNNDFQVTLMESLQIKRDHPPLIKNK